MADNFIETENRYINLYFRNNKKIWRRIISIFMVLTVILTSLMMLYPVGAYEGKDSKITNGVTRFADSSTMDDYASMINLDKDTHFAGRLWTDKTVFAYEQDYNKNNRVFDGKNLNLTEELDGLNDTVSLNSDFLHVYSALGSNIKINEQTKMPVDVVFLLDTSGSMASDIVHSSSDKYVHKDMNERIRDSRIYSFLDSMNKSIEYIMSLNETNQVSVVAYGAIAYTLMPLGHYTKIDGNDYLSVSNFSEYNGSAFSKDKIGSGAYTVKAYATRTDKNGENRQTINNCVRNNFLDNSGLEGKPVTIGYETDLQAGIYKGFSELSNNLNTTDDVTYTYKSKFTGKNNVIPRIPMALVLTDGGSNFTLKADNNNNPIGSEWYMLPDIASIAGRSYSSSFKKYRAETDNREGAGAGVILDILLTASYMKSKIVNKYTDLIDKSDIPAEYREYARFNIDTFSIDTPDKNWQIPRIYGALDPKEFLSANPPAINGETNWPQKQDAIDAYNYWNQWKGSSSGVTIPVYDDDRARTVNIPYNKLSSTGHDGVSNSDIEKNIYYNDHFYDIESKNLLDIFMKAIDGLDQPMHTPVEGLNSLGIGDAVTYMDPVGKYMEIKDVSNLLLFGKLYNIVPTAVYDYQFNREWMLHYDPENADTEAFKEGWYYGDNPLDERNAKGPAIEVSDENGSYPKADGIKSAKEAWDAGWKYYLSYKTAQKYVPTLKDTSSPDKVIRKQQLTTYTFYRFDEPTSERTKLRMNPAYGNTVPEEVEYDPNNSDHLNSLGVYTLNDIRIWVEDSGDYNDELLEGDSGIKSDANFDEALWINLPINMLPIRKVTLTQDGDNWVYETNTAPESGSDTDSDPYIASFPLRVFYSVGIMESLLTTSRDINIASGISQEYLEKNKITTEAAATARGLKQNSVEFFSNWYNPEKRYNDYVTTKNDYTYGDPMVSFSPSANNQYYSYEKELPLYKKAYVWSDGGWKAVSMVEDYTGGDKTVFDPVTFGGVLKGTYESLAAAGTGSDGDVILLESDVLDDVTKPVSGDDPFASEKYYYYVTDYFELTPEKADSKTGSAKQVKYITTRKGSEFGSAYAAQGISNGDMLCWYDISGKYTRVYPYLSYSVTGDSTRGKQYIGAQLDKNGNYANTDEKGLPTDTPNKDIQNNGTWVVATKQGGIKVGDLAQNIEKKALNADDKGTAYPKDYIDSRFPENTDLDWIYYDGNKTRTANNYCLPTVSTEKASGTNAVTVNVYLGNNGRLSVEDTTLGFTKQVILDDSLNFMEQSSKPFHYQIFADGLTGNRDAVVLRYNKATNNWQRQYHYIDLELNNKMFLQNIDGSTTQVSKDGTRIAGNADSGYTYAETKNGHTSGQPYQNEEDGGPYYVFIGTNITSDDDIGATPNGFRVYHNQLVHLGSVSQDDVVVKYFDEKGEAVESNEDENYTGKRVFYAKKVWLVSQEQYQKEVWSNPEGNPTDDQKGDLFTDILNEFELLTIDPMITDTTENTIVSNYLTNSTFWTETLYFGYKLGATQTESGEIVGTPLTADDLYDNSGSGGDKSEFSDKDGKAYTPEYLASHTAEVTLKSGYGLLLSGIPHGTDYRFTEKLMDYEYDSGCELDHVDHDVKEGSVTTYSKDGSIWEAYEPGADGERNYLYKEGKPTGSQTLTPASNFNFDNYTYSIFGDTSAYEEEVHYFNKFAPVQMTVGKELDSLKGAEVKAQDYDKLFDFTMSLSYADGTPIDGFYWFRIYNTKSNELVSEEEKKLDSSGTTKFRLKGDQYLTIYGLPVGTKYKYSISELEQPGWEPGIDVDGKTQTDSKGTYSGSLVKGEYGLVGGNLKFINFKQPLEPANVSLSASKEVEGDGFTLSGDEFSFKITPKDGNPKEDPVKQKIVHNDAKGVISFFKDEIYTVKGEYNYTVEELSGDPLPGFSYDSNIYDVTVNVTEDQTDDGEFDGYYGMLKADITVSRGGIAVDKEIVFTNIFRNEPEIGFLTISKLVKNAEGKDDTAFTFTVMFTPPAGKTLGAELPAVYAYKDGTVLDNKTVNLKDNGNGTYTATVNIKDSEMITLTELPKGTKYTVSEAECEGYVLDEEKNTSDSIAAGKTAEAQFINKRLVKFPELGGRGTYLYYIAGAFMILGAAVYFAASNNKKRRTAKND